MQTKIKTHKLGKLRIYLPNNEKVKSASLLGKMFPKSAYRQVIVEAKKDGIMNASVFPTHFGYSKNGRIQEMSIEAGNAGLTICIELIDTREKLEGYFTKHKEVLQGKVVVYKEVEFWDLD